MIIKSISIKEFGGIKNRTIDFSDGLNIIEGLNESGKSTILSFIKFIFYGLPKKSNADKDRCLSWENGCAEGSMTLSGKSGEFRIERCTKANIRGELLRIIDLATGTQVHKGEVPGELFFGVPVSVFESTACVRQLQCSNINGEDLGNALENLLLTADETTSTKKAVDKIESLRKKLLHKNQKGGSIFELSTKRDALKTRLDSAIQKSAKIIEDEAMFATLSKQCTEYKSKLDEDSELCEAYDKRQTLIRFDGLHSAKSRIDSLTAKKAKLLSAKAPQGFVPSRAYIAKLNAAERELQGASEQVSRLERALESAKSATPANVEKAALAGKIQANGGTDAIYGSYCTARKKAASLHSASLIFLILALFGAAVLAVSFLPLTLPSALETIISSTIFRIAGTVVVLIALTLTVVCFALSSSHTRFSDGICSTFLLDTKANPNVLRAHLLSCLGEKKRLEDYTSSVENAQSAFIASQTEFAECRKRTAELIAECGSQLPEGSDVSEHIVKLTTEQSALCDELDAFDRDIGKYTAVYEERMKDVEGFDESELRASLDSETLDKLSGANISVLHREYEFLRAKAESAENRKYVLDRELIALRATVENPLRPRAMLDDIERRLENDTFLHDALNLASSSLTEAAESMRRNMTPRLRRRAGEIMSVLTGGKYGEIGIGADFSVTVTADGATRPVEVLSSGTQDAAYLSVRLALISVLYRSEQPTVLLDEALSQIDDNRAAAVLSMLRNYCESGIQCLLFTCHSRESKMISSNIIKL